MPTQSVPFTSTGQALLQADQDSQVFRFRYDGPSRPLHAYLLERYSYGRPQSWQESFYPHRVCLNNASVDTNTQVAAGDQISYLHLRSDEPGSNLPAFPPPILYEDEWVLALEKGPDVPVSPGGVYYFSAMAVRARESMGNDQLTPLHRLDQETSGPLLFAKRREHVKTLHALFQQKTLRKRYLALVQGRVAEDLREVSGWIRADPDSPVHTRKMLEPAPYVPASKLGEAEPSLTRLLERVWHPSQAGTNPEGQGVTELRLEPVTGKTNQIRVHLAHVGHPIVGDKKYDPDPEVFLDWWRHRDFSRIAARLLLPRQALHCEGLAFLHPFTGEAVEIQARPGQWAERVAPLLIPRLGAVAP